MKITDPIYDPKRYYKRRAYDNNHAYAGYIALALMGAALTVTIWVLL